MSLISFDRDGNICLPKGFGKWRRPLNAVTIQGVDHGGRVTLTRVLTIGIFALGAKKQSVSVVVVTDQGETYTHKVNGKHAEATLTWAVAFNAWRDAVHPK